MNKCHLLLFLLILAPAICFSQVDKKSTLITYFSDPPSFNNGTVYQFGVWVYSNIKYPETAIKDGVSGRVIVQFFIDSIGKIDSVEIIKSLRPDIDQEVKRVIESSPVWTPAKAIDKPVGAYFSLPIDFSLNDQQFKKKIKEFTTFEKRSFKKHYR